jgi:4-amino-4-deoxy-L-arabinose transferase-like glycosyltransferase
MDSSAGTQPAPDSLAPALPVIDKHPRRQARFYILILVGLWLVIYAGTMFTPPLLDDVDSLHAEAAREMILRHDWVTLYTNGLRYLEKAPLMYWGLAASYDSVFWVLC